MDLGNPASIRRSNLCVLQSVSVIARRLQHSQLQQVLISFPANYMEYISEYGEMLSNTMNASILPHYLCFLKCFQHNIDNGQFQMASGLSTVNTVRETSAFSHSMKQTDDGVLDVIVQNMMQGVTQSALLENNYSRILARSMEVSFCIRRSKRCFIQLVLVPLPSEFQDQLFKTANSESGK